MSKSSRCWKVARTSVPFTLLEEMQRHHPDDYSSDLLRTLQRRVRAWRVAHGSEPEIFFAQEHPPGRQASPISPSPTICTSRSAVSRFRIDCINLLLPIRVGGRADFRG